MQLLPVYVFLLLESSSSSTWTQNICSGLCFQTRGRLSRLGHLKPLYTATHCIEEWFEVEHCSTEPVGFDGLPEIQALPNTHQEQYYLFILV